MALENYIIGASNTGAAGYHNAMAGMDQRKREAATDQHNAFNRQHVDRQYRDKRMADAFEQAALAYDDNDPSAALGVLNGVSNELGVAPPVPEQMVPMLRTRRQMLMAEGLPDTPSNVQEWQYFNQLAPAQQQKYLLMKRAGVRVDLGGGGVGIVNPGMTEAQTVVAPEVATGRDAGRAGAITAAEEEAKTGAIPARAPLAAAAAAQEVSAEEAARNASEISQASFKSLAPIQKSISNIDEAIQALDEGADTGPVIRMLPNVQTASIQLSNLRGRMGLDVVGATTFGALSEAELAFALDVALPTNMQPPELREWLVKKRMAQAKLAAQLEHAAIYLGKPGATVSKYLEEISSKRGGEPKPSAPSADVSRGTVNWNDL